MSTNSDPPARPPPPLGKIDAVADQFEAACKPEPACDQPAPPAETAPWPMRPTPEESAGGAGVSFPQPGQRLGSYDLLERLGGGGMGVVFRARHVLLKKEFALKVLSPRLAPDPEASRQPLPAYAQWRKQTHPFPWKQMSAAKGIVWRGDGQQLETLTERIILRGKVIVPEEAALLEELNRQLRSDERIEAAALIAFAVIE